MMDSQLAFKPQWYCKAKTHFLQLAIKRLYEYTTASGLYCAVLTFPLSLPEANVSGHHRFFLGTSLSQSLF